MYIFWVKEKVGNRKNMLVHLITVLRRDGFTIIFLNVHCPGKGSRY